MTKGSLLAQALEGPSLGRGPASSESKEDGNDAGSAFDSFGRATLNIDRLREGGAMPPDAPPSPPVTAPSYLTMTSESSVSSLSPRSGRDITSRVDDVGGSMGSAGTNDSSIALGGDDDGNDDVDDDYSFPRHSDFTIPTSNKLLNIDNLDDDQRNALMAPPLEILPSNLRQQSMLHPQLRQPTYLDKYGTDEPNGNGGERRSIMGTSVGKKYRFTDIARRSIAKAASLPVPYPILNGQHDTYGSLLHSHEVATPPESPSLHYSQSSSSPSINGTPVHQNMNASPTAAAIEEGYLMSSSSVSSSIGLPPMFHAQVTSVVSPLTPALLDPYSKPQTRYGKPPRSSSVLQPRVLPMPCEQRAVPTDEYYSNGGDPSDFLYDTNGAVPSRRPAVHETIHAQSLVLGLAFMAVWSPNNVMAPNLTQMAEFFGMDDAERDSYLGSYCALAVGVFSIPLSALIGFTADFYPRKSLFLACVVFGALSSAWTGWAGSYWSLFLARLCSGGCMSGSVPVAFSLLGDLFSTEERNAASSGLTAMMGLGILSGQVFAGLVGPGRGWQYPFFVSALLQLATAVMMFLWVSEPVRGAKEKVLQDLFKSGTKYDRQLTLDGFIHAMHKNVSNSILLWQGFFTSLPWGIVFVFLNDYLSQEKGFSVQEATFMVMLFGVGCAIGGIAGGYFGQLFMTRNRSYLPIYMAATTFAGICPFLGLLNSDFPNHHGHKAKFYAIVGGCIASLPSVCVRPCILNVNPPETRGAALTASTLLVTLGRGIGPSTITLMGSIFHVSRQVSFNTTLAGFWSIAAIQLLFLAKTLPRDQDAMEEELARYAAEAQGKGFSQEEKDYNMDLSPLNGHRNEVGSCGADRIDSETSSLLAQTPDCVSRAPLTEGESILSIEEYMTSFDGNAARRSLQFVKLGIQELKEEITQVRNACSGCEGAASSDDEGENRLEDGSETKDNSTTDDISEAELQHRRDLWLRQQQKQHDQP